MNLLQAASALLGNLLGMAESRLELLCAEWQQEKSRFVRLLIYTGLAVGCLLLAAFGLMLTAVLLTPDEFRWITALAVTLFLSLTATICLIVVVQLTARGNRPFAGTTDELKKDALCLKELVKSKESHS